MTYFEEYHSLVRESRYHLGWGAAVTSASRLGLEERFSRTGLGASLNQGWEPEPRRAWWGRRAPVGGAGGDV